MWYEKTAMILAAIGAINWGLNVLNWNAVEMLLGFAGQIVINIVYIIVALSGVYSLFLALKN
jgi:uncharacterized membrane protein YuzA (DUF378 family)